MFWNFVLILDPSGTSYFRSSVCFLFYHFYRPQHRGVLISPYPDQEGNKLERQKIFGFIYPIYNHNWRNISTIYIYRDADKSLARPGRKQATVTEDFEFHVSYL